MAPFFHLEVANSGYNTSEQKMQASLFPAQLYYIFLCEKCRKRACNLSINVPNYIRIKSPLEEKPSGGKALWRKNFVRGRKKRAFSG